TIGAGLAPLALFCRSLERCRDLFRVGEREDATFQIERVAFARDPLRPALRSCRSLLPRGPCFPARRTGSAAGCLSHLAGGGLAALGHEQLFRFSAKTKE